MARPLTIRFETYDDDGNEETVELPAVHEVCPRCDGHGSHVNPNIDGHGITAEEWERDWDDESRESYMSGVYDVPCEECGGANVVAVVDRDRCDPKVLRRYDDQQEIDRQEAYDDAMIRRMESGGYDY